VRTIALTVVGVFGIALTFDSPLPILGVLLAAYPVWVFFWFLVRQGVREYRRAVK